MRLFNLCRPGLQGLLICVFPLLATMEAGAEDITSVYTKLKLEECVQLEATEGDEGTFGGRWRCEGYQGQPVYVAEGDLRMLVSFGPSAADEPAAAQTLHSFNTINETLEWRLRDGVPFATILRWFPSLDDGAATGSVLVVTQLMPGGATCQIAWIDAKANENANDLAREAADKLAGKFDCSQAPATIGNPGILN